MSTFAYITESEDRRSRYEEAVSFEGHRLANYARGAFPDPFHRLAWAWCTAGRDAEGQAASDIRDACVEDLLSTSDRATRRLWQAFRDSRIAGSGSLPLSLQWRDNRKAAA